MPYTFKTKELKLLPRADEEIVLVSGHNHVVGDFAVGGAVYVFVEDNSLLGKYGGLVARGSLAEAKSSGKSVSLRIRFDGAKVTVGLATRDLDRFAHPHKYNLSEIEHPALSEMFPILKNIAEIRRNTTGQPVHTLSEEAASWLDLYHFEKEKS